MSRAKRHQLRWGDYWWRPRGVLTFDAARRGEAQSVRVHDTRPAPDAPVPVFEIMGGKVVGDCRLVATPEHQVLENVQFLHDVADPWNHWALRPKLRMPRRVPGTALLLAANGANYYHWLLDSLPRLLVAALAGWTAENIDHYLVARDFHPFHQETLKLLGVPVDRCLRGRGREVVQFERLVVTALPAPAKVFPLWALEFLQRELGASMKPEPSELIYISRRGAGQRRVVNEDGLLERLQPRGFKAVTLEHLPVSRQIALAAGARMIVAPHGAGLANMIFAPPQTIIVELHNRDHDNNCFALLARRRHQSILRIACDPAPVRRRVPPDQADLVAPVERVTTEIDRALALG